jgi:hypothetical protein
MRAIDEGLTLFLGLSGDRPPYGEAQGEEADSGPESV